MQDDYIASPIDHGALGAGGSITAGAGGGALKAIGKTALWCIGIGAVVGLLAATGMLPAFITSAGTGSALWGIGLGALGGGLVAAFATPLAGLLGGVKGASRASQHVALDRISAKQMDMQISAYQAAAMAQANDNKYNLPRAGTPMNTAARVIDMGSAQYMGTTAGQQLEAAR